MNTTEEKENHALQQAKAQAASIVEMVRALDEQTATDDKVAALPMSAVKAALSAWEGAPDAVAQLNDEGARTVLAEAVIDGDASIPDWTFDDEAARQAIHDDPLSVEVRSGWYDPARGRSDEQAAPVEFCILLCTGGPAVRIIGDLDAHKQPVNPRLQYQDWGTPWTELVDLTDAEREALLTYCQQFYFGE